MSVEPIIVDTGNLQWAEQQRRTKGPMEGRSWAEKIVDPPVRVPSAYRLDDKETSDAMNKAKKNPLVPLGITNFRLSVLYSCNLPN